MSFFQQEGDDSNLQYDDAAFLYFIASALVVGVITSLAFALKDVLFISAGNTRKIKQLGFLDEKLKALTAFKKRQAITLAFFAKLVIAFVLAVGIIGIHAVAQSNHKKMKGFDPFEILGLESGATLRDVKKAYRKLALEYHPDKNVGNPEAQAKFILVSKSYECFTDETKKANCFKYGNPDGQSAFRVGIGLPKMFIDVEYKWWVLPIVLSIFLLLIPIGFMKWVAHSKTIDTSGISVSNYSALFRILDNKTNKYTIIYLLACYKELSQDLNLGPISPEQKQRLNEELSKNSDAKNPILDSLNDNQLLIFWQIYKYTGRIGELKTIALHEAIEKYIEVTLIAVKPFTIREKHDEVFYNNPEWRIRFIGSGIIESICQFNRDYYNRTLLHTNPATLWLENFDLTAQEKILASNKPVGNLFNFLKNRNYDQFLNIFAEQRRDQIGRQLKNLPIYSFQSKILIDQHPTDSVTTYDYAEIKFKISHLNDASGYCTLNNYPFPKKQTVTVLMLSGGSVIYTRKVDFSEREYFIGKTPFRSGQPGKYLVQIFVISDTYKGLDLLSEITINVFEAPPEQVNMRIQFHPEDINIEKSHPSFFEQMMDLQLDPEENELSDSDE